MTIEIKVDFAFTRCYTFVMKKIIIRLLSQNNHFIFKIIYYNLQTNEKNRQNNGFTIKIFRNYNGLII